MHEEIFEVKAGETMRRGSRYRSTIHVFIEGERSIRADVTLREGKVFVSGADGQEIELVEAMSAPPFYAK